MNTLDNGHLLYAEDGTAQLNIAGASYGPRGRGAHIAYTVATSEFGFILMAATARGLCWIGIHQCASYLESELRRDFPKAIIVRDDDKLQAMAAQVLAFVDATGALLNLPVDIHATPFQLAVWRELLAIPPGATRSYGEIAQRIGRPGSARAVGRANGSNPLAVLIPCHRAVGADGRLTGYRWGLECKRRLLDYESSSSLPSSRHQL
jgi:AraC family transcriptional regulator, regulatory protein of adaptative response / methylated-DNA-[protein]-cysteine methyltransferase